LSDNRYRSVVDNSPYGIYRVAFDGRFLTVNPALCAIVGFTECELLSINIRDLYECPEERAQLIDAYDERYHGKPLELRWRRKDGTPITTRVWVYAERDQSGKIVFFDGYVEDVTALRATERALRQSEKLAAVGQVISGVAHELNNPLSAILLFTDDLLSCDRPEDEREALSIIAQQARRSRAIVRDLLSFVRSGDVVRAATSPDGLLEQIGRTLQPQTAELGVALHIDIVDAELIQVDRAAIEQVITNLVMNGAQAASHDGRPGTVWVRGRVESEAFVIDVVDDGPGISPEIMPRIFEPFFTTKPVGQGTGLGLSVTLGIVQQHGGTIAVENRSVNEGTGAQFSVRLPLVSSRANGGSVVAA
jgi:PAS domain S-box-containing protein